MTLRTYSELSTIPHFVDRYEYLRLGGSVGEETFGFERYLNQRFYTSHEWRLVRPHVIARDLGRDLGIEGYDIHDKVIVHHMNPMDPSVLKLSVSDILDPEFLISTTLRTHNAIHYGDRSLLPLPPVERFPGDTNLW